MKPFFYLLFVTVFLMFTTGCEDDEPNNKIVGMGPVVTKNLDFSSFNKIENIGVANFYITIGSPQEVVLKAQQNIIDVMTYEVINQTLKVGLKENVSLENHEEIRFDITIPAINQIELVGVGDFTLSGADQDDLSILLTGVGHVNAFEMKVSTCVISSAGVGNCEVWILNNLDVTITGVGNIYYKGNPTITSSITGMGQLIDAN